MAEPAWKVAMRERKKQKEEEEKKKKADEEARLASVPAWKRPMLLKKLEAERAAAEEKNKTTAPSSSPPLQDKWQKALEKSSKPTTTSTPEPHPSSATTPSVPAWKLALQERQRVAEAKKKLEETRQASIEVSSPISVPKAFPKQNILNKVKEQFEKASGGGSEEVESSKIVPKSTVVLQSPSGSPVILKRVVTSSPRSSPQSSPQLARTTTISSSPTGSPPLPRPPDHTVVKPSAQKQPPNVVIPSSQSNPPPRAAQTPSTTSTIDESSAEFLAMPAWKREVLMRKKMRASGQVPPTSPSTKSAPSSGSFVIPQLKSVKSSPSVISNVNAKETPTTTKVEPPPVKENIVEKKVEEPPKKETTNKPEIVNSSENAESSSPKLIQKEGKTLRAPVFQSTGKWTNISVDDPEFLKLPMWKQELLKRRFLDQANRTKPIPKEEPKEEKKTAPPPASTPWERLNETKTTSGPSVTLKATNVPPKTSPVSPSKEEEPSGPSKVQALLGRFRESGTGVVNRKIPPSAVTSNKTVGNGEVTLIDEESSDDEGPPPVMKTRRSSSILKSPEKPSKPRKLSISWSDSNLSHFYPKYDYSDYDEIEQPSVPEDTDGEVASPTSPEPVIATPIHPMLLASNTKSPPPSTNTGGLSLSSFGSANSFMSMYTLNSPLPPPISTPPANNTKPEENVSPADVYNNIDNDTAALLF